MGYKLDEIKLYFKKKFLIHVFLLLSKIAEVLFSSFIILMIFRLFDYKLTLLNYLSSIAVYFFVEELKPYLLKLRGTKR